MRKRLASILGATVLVVASTLLGATAPATAAGPTSQTGPVRIGDPAGERFALAGNPILGNIVAMVPPVAPTSWYYLNQQWFIQDAGSGGVNIVNARQFFGSDWCLVPSAPGAEPFACIYPCGVGGQDIWTLDATAGGVRVVSQSTGDCLTMPPAGSPSNSMRVEPCGGPDQVVVISAVS